MRSHSRRRPGDVGVAAGQRPQQRAGEDLGEHRHGQAGGERDPGCLHALVDRLGPVAGAEPAGGPPGGAVGQDVAQPGRDRQDAAAEGERGQLGAAEVADDGGVHQHVERLGRQHHQRGQGERGHRAGRGAPSLAVSTRPSCQTVRGGDRVRCLQVALPAPVHRLLQGLTGRLWLRRLGRAGLRLRRWLGLVVHDCKDLPGWCAPSAAHSVHVSSAASAAVVGHRLALDRDCRWRTIRGGSALTGRWCQRQRRCQRETPRRGAGC